MDAVYPAQNKTFILCVSVGIKHYYTYAGGGGALDMGIVQIRHAIDAGRNTAQGAENPAVFNRNG
ncbi:hypothetical protein [Pseudomonas poae]|uniref:hypothetical protein n=1 Tax=Pseudomonas poae TaxID=200451 RepID=UPI001E5C3774|nr:hypothetical protein [Pseudomonas poae]